INDCDGKRKRTQFLVREMLSHNLIDFILSAVDTYLCQSFSPQKSRTFFSVKEIRFFPPGHMMKAQVRFTIYDGLFDVHINAKGTLINLRCPHLYKMSYFNV